MALKLLHKPCLLDNQILKGVDCLKEPSHHCEVKRSNDYLKILYKRHFQGALVRSGASVIMWVFALTAYLANVIKINHFTGITLSVLYLILINPPTLLLVKHITHMRLYRYASLLINFLEILGYTAIIYFLGGIEATFLTPIYAALITYVGVVAPRRFPYIIAFLCSAAFSFVVAGEYFGLLPHQSVVASFDMPMLTRLNHLSVVIGLLLVVAYVSSLTAGILKKNRNKLRGQNVELMEKAASLEETEKELRTTQQELESRVEERTTELRDANDRLLREITERKNAEEALLKSEERYRTILEEMEEGYFETDLVGNLTFINEAGCRHLGYPRQELIGINNRVYADEENTKKVFQAFNKAYKTGEPCTVFDYEITRKDGTKAIIELSASLMRNSEGEPNGFRGIWRNVTERKKMEEALRQSEEKYRTILENMQEVYYEIDLSGNWIFLNEAFYEHLGYTKEELIGKKSRHYQDETTARELYQAYIRLYRTGEPIRAIEAKWISKDGTKRTSEMSASLIRDPEGKPVGFRGVSRDITERKRTEEALRQSEEKYRTILESIQDGYFEVDLAGNFTFVNNVVCRRLGYSERN